MTPTEKLADRLNRLHHEDELCGMLIYRPVLSSAERDEIVAALRASTDRAITVPTEDQVTIARRLKGCVQRREVPTWAEIEFAADTILDAASSEPTIAMGLARKIVEDHIAIYGMVPHPDKMKEAIASALSEGLIHKPQNAIGAHTLREPTLTCPEEKS